MPGTGGASVPQTRKPEQHPKGISFSVTQHRAGQGEDQTWRQTGIGVHIPSAKVNKELMVKEDRRSPALGSGF